MLCRFVRYCQQGLDKALVSADFTNGRVRLRPANPQPLTHIVRLVAHAGQSPPPAKEAISLIIASH